MTAYAYFIGLPACRDRSRSSSRRFWPRFPVALPATFTLAAALGARELAKKGVLPTRLSAVDEAGTMDVLCADKTGTLTRTNSRSARRSRLGAFDEADVLAMAAFASAEGGQDPVDLAIRAAAAAKARRAKS